MSYSRDPNKYPPNYYDLFYAALEEPLTLSLDDPGTAINYRQRLHAFRRALQHTGDSRYGVISEIMISISGSDLILRNLEKSVQEAIQRGGREVLPAPLTEEQLEEERQLNERLLRVQAKVDEEDQELPAKKETMEEVIARLYGTGSGEGEEK